MKIKKLIGILLTAVTFTLFAEGISAVAVADTIPQKTAVLFATSGTEAIKATLQRWDSRQLAIMILSMLIITMCVSFFVINYLKDDGNTITKKDLKDLKAKYKNKLDNFDDDPFDENNIDNFEADLFKKYSINKVYFNDDYDDYNYADDNNDNNDNDEKDDK